MAVESPEQYCREIEAYLCRKNDGHLIRIVGPAFERVLGWAARGIPLTIACAGIDRYFERYYAKGPRRRPVRVEFCEADVLDAFDEWRRAIGVPAPQAPSDSSTGVDEPRRHSSLPAHLDRVIARLTAIRAGAPAAFDEVLGSIITELDTRRAEARTVRGVAREAFMDRLRALDQTLMEAARRQCDAATLARFRSEADTELAPFTSRMAPDDLEQSRLAAIERLLRAHSRLPMLTFE